MNIPQQFTLPLQRSVYTACYEVALKQQKTEQEAGYMATLAAMQYDDKGHVVEQGYSIPHEAANYNPYGATGGEGCATCWWFHSPDWCRVVQGPIAPTGKSDFYLPVQSVIASLPKPEQSQNILQKIVGHLKRDEKTLDEQGGFKTLEAYGLPQYWIAWYTNPYQDRDQEFFTEKSIEADIAHMKRTGEYPELWWKHLPGTKHGQTLGVYKIGRFAVAVGQFDTTPLATAFQKFYKSTKRQIGISHGYFYPASQKQGDTFTQYHTFEISPLFWEVAANPYTGFGVKLGGKRMLTEADRQELLMILKDEKLIDQIAEATLARSKQLDELAVARKAKGKGKPEPEDDEEEEMDEETPKKKPDKKSATEVLLETLVTQQGEMLQALKALSAPTATTPLQTVTTTRTPQGVVPPTQAWGDEGVPMNGRLQQLVNSAKSVAEPDVELDPVQYTAKMMFGGFGGQS